jgi:sugar/nucleoside kinase (ribokinase family)
MDFIYRVKRLPALRETLTALSYQRAAGGKGATVGMIGCVGQDDIEKTLVQRLTEDNINIQHAHGYRNFISLFCLFFHLIECSSSINGR